MGYRSDTAYAIVCRTTEDRDKIISKVAPEQWELIKDELTIEPDRILYHDPSVKWYDSSILGDDAAGWGGFEHIAAHKALLNAAQEAQLDYEFGEDPTKGVNHLGVFMRLGEDSDDFQREVWGEDSWEGAPNWYDLIDETRELRVGWE